jgi:cystathionine gamma-synthase
MLEHGSPLGGTSIVFGFPYLDTLKLCSRQELCPAGVEFFGCGNARDLDHLEKLLRKQPQKSYSALFTEVPSNPLLQCPDLFRLRELADEFNFCIVVDDTISNFLNVDVLETGLADAVCTSLTKLVSGRGDVIAGSVVTNPHTERGRWMKQDLLRRLGNDTGGLYCQDAQAVLCNSTDFVERNAIVNRTTERLADWLLEHPDVETVYYPKHSAPMYEKVKRKEANAGYGGLLSILLHPHICQRNFYDALNVAKGPSLGTNFTLVCPYTLLAHYHELDFAMSYNVHPNLLRIAVGLEPFAVLQAKFETALRSSRLYPKICMNNNKQPPPQMRSYSSTTTSVVTVSNGGGVTRQCRQPAQSLLRVQSTLVVRRLAILAR